MTGVSSEYYTPLMGRLSPNVIYSKGYSGHGVNVTHLAGPIRTKVRQTASE